MSEAAPKRVTIRDVVKMKRDGRKLVVVTAYDVLFAKLVDSGRKIPSVEQTVKMLTDYVVMLQEHKIGKP